MEEQLDMNNDFNTEYAEYTSYGSTKDYLVHEGVEACKGFFNNPETREVSGLIIGMAGLGIYLSGRLFKKK